MKPKVMNPFEKRVSITDCAGGGTLPYLKVSFSTLEDMHAASDYIRAIPSSMERGFNKLLDAALESSPPAHSESQSNG